MQSAKPDTRGIAVMRFIVAGYTLGALVVLRSNAAIDLAAAVFGATFAGIVATIILLTRLAVGPRAVPTAIGALTACFSVGQAIGPGLAGVLAQVRGSLALPFLLSSLALLVGGLLLLPPIAAHAESIASDLTVN